jgi:hypothetical protein
MFGYRENSRKSMSVRKGVSLECVYVEVVYFSSSKQVGGASGSFGR